jgi:hypothetical protein
MTQIFWISAIPNISPSEDNFCFENAKRRVFQVESVEAPSEDNFCFENAKRRVFQVESVEVSFEGKNFEK